MHNMYIMTLTTARGPINVSDVFFTEKEAEKYGYEYYFEHENYKIFYRYPDSKSYVTFAVVKVEKDCDAHQKNFKL